MGNKHLKLSDIFDIDIVLHDGKFYYELEFEGQVLDGFTDYPIKAVLRKGKKISMKEAVYG